MPSSIPRTRAELVPLLEARGLRLSRRLGQSFLVDPALADAIVADAGVGPRDAVIEIGAGAGGLTQPLLAAAGAVTAIEIDRGLAALLRDHLDGHPRLTLVEGDCLAKGGLAPEVAEALRGARADEAFDRVLVVANLPYSCGTVVVARLLELPRPPDAIVGMLQAEVVERLRAAPGTRDYGPLAVLVALRGKVDVLRRVPPQVFFPRPAVQSALFRITPRPDVSPDARAAARLASVAFGQRRKRLAKALRGEVDEASLAAAGLDPGVRPGQVAPQDWLRLASARAAAAGGDAC